MGREPGLGRREVDLSDPGEGRTRLEMRTCIGRTKHRFHDVRGGWPEVHDPHRYDAARALGRAVRARGGNGIVYGNGRLPGIDNLAVFRPKAVASTTRAPHVTQGPHFFLSWNGARIDRYIEVGKADWQRSRRSREGSREIGSGSPRSPSGSRRS